METRGHEHHGPAPMVHRVQHVRRHVAGWAGAPTFRGRIYLGKIPGTKRGVPHSFALLRKGGRALLSPDGMGEYPPASNSLRARVIYSRREKEDLSMSRPPYVGCRS